MKRRWLSEPFTAPERRQMAAKIEDGRGEENC